MGGYRGLLTGTHLVLSRRTNSEKQRTPTYKPDIIFTLYIAPTDISLSWRAPHVVKALFASVHVDSGNYRLGDLNISLIQGVKRALYSSADGRPVIMTGKERASELRAFMRKASQVLSVKTHRLEFHCDSRGMHYEIVPSGAQEHRISSSDSSRVGGAMSSLSFTVVDDLDRSVNPVATIEEQIAGVSRSVGSVLGECVYALALAEQGFTNAEKAFNVLTDAVSDGRLVLQQVGEVVKGVLRLEAAPLGFLRAQINAVDSIRRDILNPTDNRSTSERMKRLGEEYTRLERVLQQAIKDSRRGSFASSSEVSGRDQSQLRVVRAALTDAGDSLVDSLATTLPGVSAGVFGGLSGRISSYTGWLPYTIQQGDDLQSVAQKTLGDTDLWGDLAVINSLSSSNELVVGQVLQIPVTDGGLSFSQETFSSLSAVQKALEESAFYRDILVERIGESNRWVIDESTLVDFRTVTGPKNYVQRFQNVVFQTELGTNPEFPEVGIYIGLGEPRRAETAGLTQVSSRQQLVADPRTLAVRTAGRVVDGTGDTVKIAYEVQTVSQSVQIAVDAIGGFI